MNEDEALKLARIVSHADGGCVCCVMNLVSDLQTQFPYYFWAGLVASVSEWEPSDLIDVDG